MLFASPVLQTSAAFGAAGQTEVIVSIQGADKVAVLPKDLKAGDCFMKAGSRYVFHSDGTAEFFGTTKTLQTSTYDVWHQHAEMKRADGPIERNDGRYVRVGFRKAMDSMSMAADGKWHEWNVSLTYDKSQFAELKSILWVGEC